MKQEAVRRLFMQHYGRMLRVAQTMLPDAAECEDVIHDIFESLLSDSLCLLPGTEEAYLMTSVRNRCLKRLRHEAIKRSARSLSPALSKGEGDTFTPPLEGTGEAHMDDERLTDIVEFVARRLTEREQSIFHLRFMEGRPYEEIAQMEGISRVAVWKNLSHIITEIKRQFNPRSL